MIVIRSPFSIKRLLVLCSMGIILLISIFKLRSHVPRQWKDVDVTHIMTLLLDWQYFPLDSTPVNPISSSVNLSESMQSDIFKNLGRGTSFYVYKVENRLSDLENIGLDQLTEIDIFLNFQPIISNNERNVLLYTFGLFLEICKQHNIDYFVTEGTILGVYRHMGLIPWDDDIDLVMDAANWTFIRDIFSGHKDLELHTESRFQWKVYMKKAFQHDKERTFKFPFIDIFFYKRDANYIWGITPNLKPKFIFPVNKIFPLAKRRFENFEVNVPKNMDEMVKMRFDTSVCLTADYIHKVNLEVPAHNIKNVECKYLYNLYPFVFRKSDLHTGKIVEELKISNKVIVRRIY